MSMLRDQAARRRLELNPITTSSLNVLQHPQPHQTPISALSATSLSTQFGYNPAAYTPLSAVREYNPQQWAPSPSVLSDHSQGSHRFPQARPQDPEVVTPAPPPYSPPRSREQASQYAEEPASGVSPATRVSPATAYRSSPEPSSTATFTPPPPPRPRPSGHERPQSIYNASPFAPRPLGQAPPVPHLSPDINRDWVTPPLRSPSLQPPMRPQPLAPEPLHPGEYQAAQDSVPPSSRRAASTGAISTPSSSRSRGSSTSRWEPGMPLPPPPPGLPPASRSQSMSRTPNAITSPPTRRPQHMTSSLGPVPPTPAGWTEEDIRRSKSPNRGLQIDTSSVGSSTVNPESNSGSSSSGLTRHHAVKGEPKSIRERRSESKSGKRIAAPEEPSNNPWAEAITPSDVVVPPLTILGRRPTITRSTPRSGRSYSTETPKSGEMSNHSTPVQAPNNLGSRGSTPRAPAPTPPFSPGLPTRVSLIDGSSNIPPKALPTPPPQKLVLESPPRPLAQSQRAASNEPPVAPLTISRPTSRQSMSDQLPASPAEHFARAAIERHQAFSQREAAASSDSERVRIFAEYIVMESRLRRERYAGAIDAMGSEILELTRDLFRPYGNSRRESTISRTSNWTPESSTGPGSRSLRSSVMQHDTPQLQSEPTSGSGPPSPALPQDTNYWNNYKPSLSPIPSMSVSEALDGSDSRGRPSSRWWEVSDGGSQGNPSMRLERSKRESKYMGVPKELREKLQYDGDAVAAGPSGSMAGPSNQNSFGPDEYPAEKVGLPEHDPTSPPPSGAMATTPGAFSPQPFTPNPDHLDVSRLVTLPPPYPRHHPAVNNNHPDLTSIRTTVRSLSDFTEIEATKARFLTESTRLRTSLEAAASLRRTSMRTSVQREIESGNMTFADAAQVEATALVTEQEKTKEASKAEFQLFQDQVITPLNDLLMDRVNRATQLFEQLRSQLSVEAQQQDPNSTQEEGDEQPELLEKLTLLKWIFEAREVLHRELYDLLTDRNDRYKEMVITPYRLANNLAKVDNATKFFAADALQRKLKNEQDILKRTEDFMDVIEKNVRDGVEALLNAFWDIAPDLSRITARVPDLSSLANFKIQIPASEYEENPAYYEFPMQYLYSLLAHAEKSTYQFIESQTNLLCLLHEVKTAVTAANCRLIATQRVAQGEGEEEVQRELGEVEKDEEGRLTDDLKEKVGCVEDLWSSGLGTELKGVKERVVRFLVEQGGWIEDE